MASALDTLWIFTLIIWTSIFNRSLKWLKNPQTKEHSVFIAIGILYAIFLNGLPWNLIYGLIMSICHKFSELDLRP